MRLKSIVLALICVFGLGNLTGFLLSQSTVHDNAARSGAGLQVLGSARVEQSTFVNNTAVQMKNSRMA